jgi:hypothetical protein
MKNARLTNKFYKKKTFTTWCGTKVSQKVVVKVLHSCLNCFPSLASPNLVLRNRHADATIEDWWAVTLQLSSFEDLICVYVQNIFCSALYGFDCQFIRSLGLKTIFNFDFYFMVYVSFVKRGKVVIFYYSCKFRVFW